MDEEAVKVNYIGDGKRIVFGKYMYPGDVREVSAKQAAELAKVTVKRKKVFRIVKAKKKAETQPVKPKGKGKDEQPPDEDQGEKKGLGSIFDGLKKKNSDDPPDGGKDDGGEE